MSIRPLLTLLLGLLLLQPAAADDEVGFTVNDADTELRDQVYLLDADLDLRFSEETLEALDSGVPLTVSLDISVQQRRSWYWFDSELAALEQRYRLHYYPLSGQYLVRNVNSGALYAYPTLSSALAGLGRVRDLPLIDQNLIEPDADYQVELRARLDIESLPAPLRPLAYVTPSWRLSSDWYLCSLTP